MKKATTKAFTRICATCLADVLVRQCKTAKVVYWQDSHKCDECSRRNIAVFVAEIYDPMERLLNGAKLDPVFGKAFACAAPKSV